VSEKSFGAFDYVIVVFLNLGYFYRKKPVRDGYKEPEFYTLSRDWIQNHHRPSESGWQRVHTRNEDLDAFKDEKGFEFIAADRKRPC
jgi:hypothetical protein